MSRQAETSAPITDVIANRWSPRAFNGEPVSNADLVKMLEAARWAASAFNAQPWRFIVASKNDAAEFDRMVAGLGEFNQVWAKNAGAMIYVTAWNVTSEGRSAPTAKYDAGLAVSQLVLEAQNNGLYCHQMAGINRDVIREMYNVPENFDILAAVAVGYLAPADTLSEKLMARETAPRARKPLSEIAFSGDWGSSVTLD